MLVTSLPLLGRRWVDPVAAEVRHEHGRVNAHLVDSIQGLRELIAFGRGEARAAEVTEGSGRLGAAQQNLSPRLQVVRFARFARVRKINACEWGVNEWAVFSESRTCRHARLEFKLPPSNR